MDIFPYALLSGILSGAVASLVSVGIEKFGGIIGGVLGSSPSTLMAACVGLWLTLTKEVSQQSIIHFQKSMLVVAPGMLINSLFLYSWKILPTFLSKISPRIKDSTMLLLGFVSTLSLLIWLVGASIVVIISRSITPESIVETDSVSISYILSSSQSPMFYYAVVAMIVHLSIGLTGTWNSVVVPKSKAKVTFRSNALRGIAAGIPIFAAVYLGKVNPGKSNIPILISFSRECII